MLQREIAHVLFSQEGDISVTQEGDETHFSIFFFFSS